ncbi:MAG TPA: bifunctional phosphopantothenoylcysteine decarboxylase/phosphopantothenate--cysteine ligase CoaBC [Clostridiaceae bacterium]
MPMGKNIVIGVTGGIAVYKALDLISKFKKEDFEVNVIMTKAACEFVNPITFQSISQNLVAVEMFEEPVSYEIRHISLAKKADLFIVVPATANFIGKLANGIADDLLTTTIMATRAKVVIAPAMNTNMYTNPIVQENIEKLKALGYMFVAPEEGRLACGDVGIGKLASIDTIFQYALSSMCDKKDLCGKKVLVTAGPTIASIDPVRYITNRSSGKMGYAIAKEARDRGAKVTLISGPTSLEDPFDIEVVHIKTNDEMLKAILDIYDKMDIVIKAAAVADFRIKEYNTQKIKKSKEPVSLDFVLDTDILKLLGEKKGKQILIGFAAESENLLQNAKIKLKSKNLDYIVANNITFSDSGFDSEDNKVTIIDKDEVITKLDKMSKKDVSEKLFDIIATRL